MDCETARKNMNGFLRGTLKSLEQRRTYYHIEKCSECKEVLLDEFSFYTTFNDLDTDLDFNYVKGFEKFLRNVKEKIESGDEELKIRYTILSILICILFIIILYLAIRLVYA